MARKRTLLTFKEAAGRGPYDEYPVLPADVEPQLHLSVNDRPQPFFLICEKDCVLVQMTGGGRVEFREGPLTHLPSVVGDFVYVPARTPHQILPDGPSIQYRYKAADPGYEAVCWYCPECGRRIAIEAWNAAEELPQEGYLRACLAFNATPAQRTCACGHEHPPIDLSPYNWAAIASELRAEAGPDDDW